MTYLLRISFECMILFSMNVVEKAKRFLMSDPLIKNFNVKAFNKYFLSSEVTVLEQFVGLYALYLLLEILLRVSSAIRIFDYCISSN